MTDHTAKAEAAEAVKEWHTKFTEAKEGRLTALRDGHEAGLTYKELGELTDMSESGIYRVINPRGSKG